MATTAFFLSTPENSFCRGLLSEGHPKLCNHTNNDLHYFFAIVYSHHHRHISINPEVLYPNSSAAIGSKRGRYLFVASPIVLDLACASISQRISMECARKQSILSGTGLHDLCWVDWCPAVHLLIVHILLPHCCRDT
jgi:hypothetical protein